MRLLFCCAIVFNCLVVSGQETVKDLDKALQKKYKGKLKLLQTGSLADGFAVTYIKSDKSIFSVEKRELYKTGDNVDSATSFAANFRNDTVFRIVLTRTVARGQHNKAILYLEDNKIARQEIKGEVFIPGIETMIRTAEEWLAKAKVKIERVL